MREEKDEFQRDLARCEKCQLEIAAHLRTLAAAARQQHSLSTEDFLEVRSTLAAVQRIHPRSLPRDQVPNDIPTLEIVLNAAVDDLAERMSLLRTMIATSERAVSPRETLDLASDEALLAERKSTERIETLVPIAMASTVFVIAVITTLGALFVSDKGLRGLFPSKSTPTYQQQLAALESTKGSIRSLLSFIDEQQKQLALSEDAVAALKQEESRMHPIVEADRKVIDAMFAVQEQRNQAAQLHERWMGFWIGVLASMVATFLCSGIVYLVRRRKRAQ